MGCKITFLCLIVLFILPSFSLGRPIINQGTLELISDGVQVQKESRNLVHLNQKLISADTCTEAYESLPCTTAVLGNVFLVLVYGYLMLMAAKFMSCGSEILLQIVGPGLVGGLFLPVLSSIPDAAIILASGLSGSKETAQTQVSVGIGLLAGSTVLLLTLLWGSCLIVGKCDLENSVAIDQKDTKASSLTGFSAVDSKEKACLC